MWSYVRMRINAQKLPTTANGCWSLESAMAASGLSPSMLLQGGSGGGDEGAELPQLPGMPGVPGVDEMIIDDADALRDAA